MWQRITRTKYTRDLEAEVARQRAELDRQRAELDRLRAENCALLNSILGIAGIPPLPISPGSTSRRPGGPVLPAQSHSESARADDESTFRPPPPAKDSAGQKGLPGPRQGEPGRSDSMGGHLPVEQRSRPRNDSRLSVPHVRPLVRRGGPLRRRSWHQINRILEIESARIPNHEA